MDSYLMRDDELVKVDEHEVGECVDAPVQAVVQRREQALSP